MQCNINYTKMIDLRGKREIGVHVLGGKGMFSRKPVTRQPISRSVEGSPVQRESLRNNEGNSQSLIEHHRRS